jgi:hypothetical protein
MGKFVQKLKPKSLKDISSEDISSIDTNKSNKTLHSNNSDCNIDNVLKKKNIETSDDSVNSLSGDSDIDGDDTYVEKDFKPEIFFEDNQRQFRYYKMIDQFFKGCDKNAVEKMVRIINKDKSGGDCISLRVLEWVVTKFSKKNVDINIDDKEYFSINIMYKAQLKSYKKSNFDPFRRDRKFMYNYDKKDQSKKVITTLGQLNFFKWAISNKIIECVERHYETIIEAMNKFNKVDKLKKKKKKLLKSKKDIETKSSKSSVSNRTKIDIKSFTVEFD